MKNPEHGYSVVRQFSHPPGRWQTIAHEVDVEVAMAVAEDAVKEAERQDGYVFAIAIIEAGGYACLLWEYGRGVTYPALNMRSESDVERRATS